MLAQKIEMIYQDIEIEMKDLLTQSQAAALLGITVAGVRAAMDAGRLPIVLLSGKSRRRTIRKDVERYKSERS